jgi:hypothetical protein
MLLLLGRTPFHPQTLYEHVKDLEDACTSAKTPKAQVAVAKAVVAATASFVEGCLYELLHRHLFGKIGNKALVEDLLKKHRTIQGKVDFAAAHDEYLGATWTIADGTTKNFVEGRGEKPHLISLRNAIDHGDKVLHADLKLDNIAYFRTVACEYVEQVYASFNDPKPGWLGK